MNKFLGVLLACGLVVGCSNSPEDSAKYAGREIQLSVGEKQFVGYESLMYAGMVSDFVFSTSSDTGDSRTNVNVFFPVDVKTIKLRKTVFEVESVTPEKLVVKILRVDS